MSTPENGPLIPAIRWPVPKNNRGGEFSNLEEMLAHLEGEATGHWLIGRHGMWHGGIHITDTTTPWCALSGQAINEAVDFPVPFKGEQAVRCMADGEVVAYRINRDYLSVPWYWGDLRYSGSFVLIRHRVQPGKTAESGLTFYTLYMHLAPWLAYPEQDSTAFKVADGQRLNAYVDAFRQWVAAELPPGTRVTWDKTVSADTMTGSNGRQYAHVTLAEPVTGSMSLNAGDRVWTVCDKGNLMPARDSAARPAWWSPFLPPSREAVQFDTVVCPIPYPIKAGEPVGHLGYFQVPTESGHEKRYQVHIECLTTDDLPHFLSNPEDVGRDTPTFARCPKDIPVYLQVSGGEIQKGLITTQTETVMALSGRAVTDKEGKRFWPGGLSRGLLAESDVQLLSRYDLGGRGFDTTEDSPAGFDHLNGETQPKGLVKTIFERFFSVADNDGKLYSKVVAFNYRQLLDKIDDGKSVSYSPDQYRRAVQNPSMRDHLYRLCVKHPSDWYYSSEAPVWKTFFTPQLKRDAPEWYAYSMKFLTDIRWMYRVAGMVENPWHMHPLVFLDAININLKSKKPIDKEFVKFVFDEAKRDELTSHVPAAITTAQAILETGYGKSVPVDIYSGEYSNNLFGIKAHGNPSFVYVNTHEFINGVKKPMVDKFMKYDSYEESISGRSDFFIKNKRYHFLFDYTDPNDWAKGLQRAGYATDPNYADKLIKIMKREGLL